MPVHVIAARIYSGSLLYLGNTEGVLDCWHLNLSDARRFPEASAASVSYEMLLTFLEKPFTKSPFPLRVWSELHDKARVVDMMLVQVDGKSLTPCKHKLITLGHCTDPVRCDLFVRFSSFQ